LCYFPIDEFKNTLAKELFMLGIGLLWVCIKVDTNSQNQYKPSIEVALKAKKESSVERFRLPI